MRKVLCLVLLMCLSIAASATCSASGTVIGVISSGASGASVTNNGQTSSGCSATLTALFLLVSNVSAASGTVVTLNFYNNTTCTGTPSFSTSAGAASGHGTNGSGTIVFPTALVALGGTGQWCFNATGAAGFIITAGFDGYWS